MFFDWSRNLSEVFSDYFICFRSQFFRNLWSKMNVKFCCLKKSNKKLLIIRQKSESQNECFKKTKHAKFSEKRTFITPWYPLTYVCVSGCKKCLFFGKFSVLCFLETSDLRFALLPYYGRNVDSPFMGEFEAAQFSRRLLPKIFTRNTFGKSP